MAGCSQLQPYERPAVAMPNSWAGGVAGQQAAPLAWQDFITAPELRALVEQALQNNRDARIAALQVEQLRAQYRVRDAARWPTVSAGVTGSRQTTGESKPISSTYTAGLQFTGWELDFFGRLDSLREASRAQYLASEEALRSTRVALVAGVASGWLSLQSSEALLALTRQTLSTREESLRLTRLRYDAGTASALDLRQAESLVESSRVTLAQQQRQRALDLNALALLVGQPVDQPLGSAQFVLAPNQDAVADVPVGLPSRVLLERPDIRSAEQKLVAANAQIGAARAAFFPRIALTASVGSASSELSGLFKGGSWGWALAPQALLTVFDSGANKANLASAQAERGIALAQYEKAIQTAFREVNDALVGRETLIAQQGAQEALVRAETERLRLASLRERQGVSSQLEVLDAQRSLFAAEQGLVQARFALQQARVALFKATGGV
jgi:multidrug efflux system outer membrane protein